MKSNLVVVVELAPSVPALIVKKSLVFNVILIGLRTVTAKFLTLFFVIGDC